MDRTLGGRDTVRDVLVDAEKRLRAVGVDSASFDAAEIVAFAMGTSRTRLFLQDRLESEDRVRIEQLLARRLSRVPLQHLTGRAGFRRIDVEVGPGVFIPRPETELVTEAGVRELLLAQERIAVDLCSGSGAIAISLGVEVPNAEVHAVEMSDEALVWTRRNVAAHADRLAAVGSRVDVVGDDAGMVAEPGHALSRLAGRVAVVVTNPPYIPDGMLPKDPEVRDHEPRLALYGGSDGLDVVRAVVRTAAVLLRPGGLLCVEHADIQGKAAGAAGVPGVVAGLVADDELSVMANLPRGRAAFREVVDRIDLNGLPRFTLARRTEG